MDHLACGRSGPARPGRVDRAQLLLGGSATPTAPTGGSGRQSVLFGGAPGGAAGSKTQMAARARLDAPERWGARRLSVELGPVSDPTCEGAALGGLGRTSGRRPHADRRHFQVCGVDRISGLRTTRKALWTLRDSNSVEQAMRVAVGRGSVTIVNSTPFGNQALLDGDDAALFVAATQLRRGDSIWFVTEGRSASLLELIWKSGAPVVLLLLALIAAWLWRATARFGPPLAPTEPAR